MHCQKNGNIFTASRFMLQDEVSLPYAEVNSNSEKINVFILI